MGDWVMVKSRPLMVRSRLVALGSMMPRFNCEGMDWAKSRKASAQEIYRKHAFIDHSLVDLKYEHAFFDILDFGFQLSQQVAYFFGHGVMWPAQTRINSGIVF